MRKILSGNSRSKGVTLITLIIAITIFGVFVTVFSYIMIAKHGAEALYVQSTQAYAVAQAGIEYGIRYAADTDDYDGLEAGISRSLDDNGNFTFTLEYAPATETVPSLLTSTGTVGIAVRQIRLLGFVGWAEGGALTLNPGWPPWES